MKRYFFRPAAVLAVSLLLTMASVEIAFRLVPVDELVIFANQSDTVSRKTNDLSANFQGKISRLVRTLSYNANQSMPRSFDQGLVGGSPRTPGNDFVLEVPAQDLLLGINELNVELTSFLGSTRTVGRSFLYDTEAPSLPLEVTWNGTQALEVQDGFWEKIDVGEETRVRPVPGSEDYDRLLLVTGAFTEGRRIEVEATFRSRMEGAKHYGFGVIPFWGGHNDNQLKSPRRGWTYGIAWYYSTGGGLGLEFSHKIADRPHDTVKSYRPYQVETGKTYQIEIEGWPEKDEAGNHARYVLRMRWREKGLSEPGEWMELEDNDPAALPFGGYAVALVAHRTQVEFGPIVIAPLAE